ncbi:transposase, partial [Phaeovulum sp.]|uniref:transposase n=1 Tax=Phaeovulum sp. TaxID=2934796 RepID=UPI0039E6E2B2
MEHRDDYQSEAAALTAIAGKLGCSPDSLRVWMRQIQRDGGERPGPTSAEIARIKELEREVRELRQANEILRKGEPVKAPLVQAHWRTLILPSPLSRFACKPLPGNGCTVERLMRSLGLR